MKLSYYWKPLLQIKFKKSFFPLIVDEVLYLPIEYYATLLQNNMYLNNNALDTCFFIKYVEQNLEEVAIRLNKTTENKKWNKDFVLIALNKLEKYIKDTTNGIHTTIRSS